MDHLSSNSGVPGRLLSQPILGSSWKRLDDGRSDRGSGSTRGSVGICAAHVVLSMSGPILLDWVKRRQGGTFRFSVAALTLYAYSAAAVLGVCWTVILGPGLKALKRPDMLWRFWVCASLFTSGDIASFMSMRYLDPGVFSLIGKAFTVFLTVVFSRVVLGRRQSLLQYWLCLGIVVSTLLFCTIEAGARGRLMVDHNAHRVSTSDWYAGLVLRVGSSCITSLAAVLQEKILVREPGMHFMMQQCWMSTGAIFTSVVAFWVLNKQPLSHLLAGFDDWAVVVVVFSSVAHGFSSGLLVKRLGATSKAFCVPISLGGCYTYAVFVGSAVFALKAVLAWAMSTLLIVAYAATKTAGNNLIRKTATN